MSEENRNRGAAFDPTELWRQWFETGTKMWSDVLKGSQENYIDPFGLYQQWFDGLNDLWQQALNSSDGSSAVSPFAAITNNPMMAMMNPATAMQGTNKTLGSQQGAPQTAANMGTAEAQNLWKQWFEAMNDTLQQSAALGTEAVKLSPRWLETLEQIRHNFISAEGYPSDPLQFATRWYNATSGPLSEFIGDLLEREDILGPSSQLLQNYASFYRVFRRDSEEYLKGLSIPVRSDVARVAGLVVALEDKFDRLEEAFEDFEYGYAEPATAESVGGVEEHIGGLEKRLGDVESKIDRLLAALENAGSDGSQAGASQAEESNSQGNGSEVLATEAARRKAQELGVNLEEIGGTGSNGQITVDDVRRADARTEGES